MFVWVGLYIRACLGSACMSAVCFYVFVRTWEWQKRPLLSVSIDIEALVDKTTASRFVASVQLWQLPGVCKLHQGHTSIFFSHSKSVTSLMMEGGSLEAIKENIFAWLDIEPGKMQQLMRNIFWRSFTLPIYLFSFTEGNFIAFGCWCF